MSTTTHETRIDDVEMISMLTPSGTWMRMSCRRARSWARPPCGGKRKSGACGPIFRSVKV